jgi:hypothetical protein
MILVPKFSEFIAPLFFHSYITNCLLHYIYLVIVCFVLGNSVSETLFEDFQEHVFEESEDSFIGKQGKCP